MIFKAAGRNRRNLCLIVKKSQLKGGALCAVLVRMIKAGQDPPAFSADKPQLDRTVHMPGTQNAQGHLSTPLLPKELGINHLYEFPI